MTGAPKLKSLPSTSEAFKQNVRRTHFQVSVWKAALAKYPPELAPRNFGWEKDEASRWLLPDTISEGIALDPLDVLKVIRCGCAMDQPRITARCMCGTAQMACTIFCGCHGMEERWTTRSAHLKKTWTVTVMTSTCVITDDRECFEGVIHRVGTDCSWIM